MRAHPHLALALAALPALSACIAHANPLPPHPPLPDKTLDVAPNPENVVASELLGRWSLNLPLTSPDAKSPIQKLLFKDDPATARKTLDALAQIVERMGMTRAVNPQRPLLQEALTRVFLAGAVEITSTDNKTLTMGFVLVSIHGNPHLLILEPTSGALESANIMLARDLTGDRDLLFIGGAFNDQSFATYSRSAD